ncbi:IS66 family insertion sequence element accessory protein TnpA [Massilia genomosp. 1]|uniref:IS66 family insertion sequence element accessory protein TnpB n=1 Tax=Massilia genomosp. 1 TaxID=2609280 RepID=A0ABX0MHW2_9BURK|nr:hypothetical protein [Massilia genomosp. 1]NHZ62369.1 hypothetical protein [Massilia genomosp. 1]
MDAGKRAVKRVNRTDEQWRHLLSRFATSGMSVREFCKMEKVSESSFHRRRGTPGVATLQGAFVDVGVVGAVASADSAGKHVELRIELGDGLVLTLVRH